MPVYRFHDFDAARRALWCAPDDPLLADRIRQLWRFTARLVVSDTVPRGVRRFRTIEEANAERDRRITDRVQALLAARAAGGPETCQDRKLEEAQEREGGYGSE